MTFHNPELTTDLLIKYVAWKSRGGDSIIVAGKMIGRHYIDFIMGSSCTCFEYKRKRHRDRDFVKVMDYVRKSLIYNRYNV